MDKIRVVLSKRCQAAFAHKLIRGFRNGSGGACGEASTAEAHEDSANSQLPGARRFVGVTQMQFKSH
jgi:hypothetical protein